MLLYFWGSLSTYAQLSCYQHNREMKCKEQTICLNFKLCAYHRAHSVVMVTWPGDTSDEAEKHPQWQDGDQKPGKDDAHHPQAK